MSEISMNGVGGVAIITMRAKTGETLVPGMAVTLTGDNEVGLGAAAGSAVFGVIIRADAKQGLAAVQTSGFHDGVKLTAAAANQPAAGAAAVCNNKGELVKLADAATAAGASRGAVVTAVDAAGGTATLLL